MTDTLVERLLKPIDADRIWDWLVKMMKATKSDHPRLGFQSEMDLIDLDRKTAAARITVLEADVARLREVVAIMHTAFAAYADSPAKKEAIDLATLEARNG